MSENPVAVEVVLAFADRQELVSLELSRGATVADAVSAGLAGRFPGVDLEEFECGVWGKPVARQRQLEGGERVELYRPLRIDPRDARRAVAAVGGSMGASSQSADDST